jgi:RND family efflux transporter MFP subunit
VVVTIATPNGSATSGITASGQVTSVKTANISTRVMGYITRVHVKIGDRVGKGQLLATISNNDIMAKKAQTVAMISEAEASLKSAQKDYQRFTNLYEKQSASTKELDNVTLQYSSAKSRLEAAQQMRNEVNAMLAYTTLKAPFAGVVTQKMAEEGSIANPGMPLLTLEQSSDLEISATVAETDISKIKRGDVATVAIKSSGRSFNGAVTEIIPSSQFTGGQYLVKVSIPQNEKKNLYAGMYANILIAKDTATTTENKTVLVPFSSLVQNDQLTGVYTISAENTALLRWVRTGKTYGDKVEILSGLGRNEKFILNAESKLYNGAPLTIRQ